jgi:branched-chain amino acid aminotransferase
MDDTAMPATEPGTETFPPGTAYVDRRFCSMAEARIPVLDFGFLRSDATYDVVHVWKRRFFRLDRHMERFLDNVEKLRMTLPFGRQGLEEILIECVRRSGLDDAYVEMICTRGMSPTFSRDPRDAVNRFIAFAIPFGWVGDEEQRRRGLHIAISTITRIPPQSVDPTVKNYHWLDLVGGLYEAYERGAENVILVDGRGNVAEGPGFNIFAARDGTLTTPGTGVLHGVTRQTTLELAAELGIPAEAAPLAVADLKGADEAFLTSTAGGIIAITRLDDAPVGGGRPGPITRRLTKLYWQKHDDPAWTTAVD